MSPRLLVVALLLFVLQLQLQLQPAAAFGAFGRSSFALRQVASVRRSSGSSCTATWMAKDKGKSTAPADTEFNWKAFKKGTEEKMTKSLDSIQAQFNTLRAGGANPAMLDRIFVDCFGTPTPLQQIARVASSGSQTIVVEPFDKSLLKEIEKAIATSDLNLTPTNSGDGIVRINVPPLTEDRRKELVKQAKVLLEDGKVAVRNHRRDAVDKVKDLEKGKAISKDDAKGFQDDLQKVTDDFIKKLDVMLKKKEEDLLKL